MTAAFAATQKIAQGLKLTLVMVGCVTIGTFAPMVFAVIPGSHIIAQLFLLIFVCLLVAAIVSR